MGRLPQSTTEHTNPNKKTENKRNLFHNTSPLAKGNKSQKNEQDKFSQVRSDTDIKKSYNFIRTETFLAGTPLVLFFNLKSQEFKNFCNLQRNQNFADNKQIFTLKNPRWFQTAIFCLWETVLKYSAIIRLIKN